MRVLHFYKTSFPDTMGGVEQVIDQICRGVAFHGIDAQVLSLSRRRVPRSVSVNGYTVHRARSHLHIASTDFSASAFLRFSQLARHADLIHYHFPWPFMDVVHFATRVRKPTVVTYHSDIVRQRFLHALYRPVERLFLSDVDRIVATSPNYVATSEDLRGYGEKVSVIPIGVDKSTYPEATPARLAFWRERLPPKFYLFVGVIRYYKGLHILLDAAVGTDYPIIIVGAGPIEAELRRQTERLGLRNVQFLGYLPDEDKVALLSLCFGVVFPSHLRAEAFGISLLEGAMYGKPMISSEIGTGTSYVNIDGETGLVVPPSRPDALRDAMEYLWQNPQEAARMGKNAGNRYRILFSAERMATQYVELYRGLLVGGVRDDTIVRQSVLNQTR